MSYGIVRIQKMSSGSVKGIEIHDRREKEGVSHTNKDIDWNRTEQNYDLCPDHNSNFSKAVNNRIKKLNLKKAVRKDAVVLAQVLVTSDSAFFNGLSAEQQRNFFEDSYNFLADRYGRENIISATVHLDERTPHMHFNFVPVTADGRLSAKSILTREALIEQQTAFHNCVGASYGLQRGLQGGKAKHLEITDLKLQTAHKTLQRERQSISEAQKTSSLIKSKLKPLQVEYEAKKAYVRECDRLSDVSVAMPSYAKVSKMFGKESVTVPKEMWIRKHVSAHEKTCLENATETFEKEIEKFRSSSSDEYITQIETDNKAFKRQILDLKSKNRLLQTKYDKVWDKINDVLSAVPPDVAESFQDEWNNPSPKQDTEREEEREF